MPESFQIIQRFQIEFVLLCVPNEAAAEVAEKCTAAGIKSIVNFTLTELNLPKDVKVLNFSFFEILKNTFRIFS